MRPFFAFRQKGSSYRGAYRVPLFNLSVCVSVSVCVTFVVFTDCESCTRPISTTPGSTEAGQYRLTHVTCFLACRLELDAVAGLMWLSWCVFGWGGFFFRVFSMSLHVQIRTSRAASVDSVKVLRQPICPQRTRAHLSPPGAPEKYFALGVIS